MKPSTYAAALLALLAAAPLAAQDEGARLRAHFLDVERELLARDVSRLSPAQREARAEHVAVLREYREAGVFPHNHDFPGERRPYFVDRHGTPCAMAYLIARSGRADLVERVAETRNLALVPELAGDPELVAWLDSAGLSLEEAARIQPTYGYRGNDDEVTAGYAYASALTLGVEGGLIAWNLAAAPGSGRVVRGSAGLAGGALGMVVGAAAVFGTDGDRVLGALNTVAGVSSAALGLRTLIRGVSPDPADRPTAPEAPVLAASPWVGRRGESGVVVRLSF